MEKILIIDTAVYYSTVISLVDFETMEMKQCIEICFNMMKKAIVAQDPDMVFFTSECKKENNWRTQYYSLYKLSRKEKTDKAKLFIELILDMIDKHPKVNLVSHDNLEGDDLIFSIVDKYQDYECIIYTKDKDMLQNLIYPNVKVYMPEKISYETQYGSTYTTNNYTLYDKQKFIEKFKFDVEYYRVHKAIAGDPSDGYLGIPLMGTLLATEICLKMQIHAIQCQDYSDIFKLLDYKEYKSELWYKRLEYENNISSNDMKSPNLQIAFIIAGFRKLESYKEAKKYKSLS
jgi:5'-3' exonuclease